MPGESEIMNIWIFALSLDENDSDNQRPFCESGEELGEGHFRDEQNDKGVKK